MQNPNKIAMHPHEREQQIKDLLGLAAKKISELRGVKTICRFEDAERRKGSGIGEDTLIRLAAIAGGFDPDCFDISGTDTETTDIKKMIAYHLRTVDGWTFSRIAKLLRKKDHTTIVHHVRTFYDLLGFDPPTQRRYEKLKTLIYENGEI